MTSTTPPRAAIVFNPVKINRSRLERAVDAAARRHGWGESSWIETTKEDPGMGQAQQAVAEGVDMVIACGGDGTVRAVATGLRGTETALAIVPRGTGNLLARNLSLPLDIANAVDAAFGGCNTHIDVCTAELTRPDGTQESLDFVVMAGVGLDAQMIVNTDDNLKKQIGFLAYGFAIAKSLTGGNHIKLDYQINDGEQRHVRAHSVIIGNCGDLVGNLPLLPDARADDGIFDVVLLRPGGVFGWAQILAKLLHQMWVRFSHRILKRNNRVTGEDNEIHSLRYATATTLNVTLRHPEIFEVDGDEAGEVTGFNIAIDPGSLVVRAPSSEDRHQWKSLQRRARRFNPSTTLVKKDPASSE
ncbi:diacylglycerol/lipid kinase family protein [Corynebacterium alimapuense]|uniref:DAGKc domain-containing protein n=1 Tax=Corynebacterium alimapuense TaxID=1576874 RepID=A0A3M8K7B3_9CORY|nr:diacylglycerol kinase family protein [Corynebacterium alimapuense]RNE49103.1 hypothetical protein C5L39_01550 [Corynebacterium alimapuense]